MSNVPINGPADSAVFEAVDPPDELLADLRDADLRGRDLRRMNFRGRDLAGAHLEGARLDGADLRDAGLSRVNLSGACLRGARLDGSELSGADLTRADLREAVLDGTTLEDAVLHDTNLAGARARNTAWRGTEAREGDWSDADLRGSSLHSVDFSDLDLRRATLTSVLFDDSDLKRLRLSETRLSGVRLVDCSLEDVELRGAHMVGAEVRFANFTRVDLEGADLSGTTFESIAFRASRVPEVKAEDARFVRCAGLSVDDLELLGAAGARVALPLPVRAWRAISGVPGGQVAFVGALAVVLLLAWFQLRPDPAGAEADAETAELLEAADDVTRERWADLQKLYREEPVTRLQTLAEMAAMMEDLGQLDAAEDRLREAAGIARLDPAVDPTVPGIALAGFLLRHARPEEAFDVGRQVIDEAPSAREQIPGYLVVARARMLQDDPDGAVEELASITSLLSQEPTAPVAHRLQAASLLVELGEVSAALTLLGATPDDLPAEGRAQAALLRADLLVQAGDMTAAREAYDAVLDEFPDMPLIVGRARAARESAFTSGPDPDTERRQLQELSMEEDPEVAVRGLIGLARLDVRMDDQDAAVVGYQEIIRRFADRPALTIDARRDLAYLRLSGGNTDEARDLLTSAERLAETPDQTVDVREDLARVYEAQGEYDRALAIVERSVTDFPDDSELVARARLTMAGIADKAGKVQRALTLYREVAESTTDPTVVAAAVFGEATLLRRLGKTDDAVPLMDQALEVLPVDDPLRGQVAVERAEVLVELGQASVPELEAMLAEARPAGQASAPPPPAAELRLLFANQLAADGRHEDSLAVFQRVAGSPGASEDPGLKQAAVEGQVAVLVALGRREQADALLGTVGVSEMTSGDAEESCAARTSLARSRAAAHNFHEAFAELEAVFEDCRSPAFLVQELPLAADLLVEQGEGERAQRILVTLKGSDLAPVALQATELELARLGSADDAEAAMRGPDPSLAALARIERGEQLVQQGMLAEAEPLWQRVLSDEGVEPIPRSLALLGLARLELARANEMAARGYLLEVQVVDAEPWLVQEARGMLAELEREGAPEAP